MRLIFSVFILFFQISVVYAATSIPFTITMSEAVNVTGTPRIAVDVGGVTRYATYSSGTGTNALTFTYQMVSGDMDLDGVLLSSPIDLNGGTITDNAGNPATLTFTPPDTSGVLINAAVPSGYTAAFIDDTVTNINKTDFGFTLNYNKANKTLHYSIASSGGGTPITGTATTIGAAQNITGLNVSTLPDGKLTLSVYLTDSIGGTGATVTDTAPMAVLDNSLVGHWTFDANDISGTTAYDRSGQGHDAVISNGPVLDEHTLLYNGNYETARMYGLSGTLSSFTAGLWFKTTSSNAALLNSGNTRLYLSISGGRVYVKVFNGAGENFQIGSDATYNDNQYHLFYVVWDGATIKMYMDGNEIKSGGTYSSPWQMQLDWFWVGSYNYGTCPSSCANTIVGNIDDPRFYNRALTPSEIAALYNATQ